MALANQFAARPEPLTLGCEARAGVLPHRARAAQFDKQALIFFRGPPQAALVVFVRNVQNLIQATVSSYQSPFAALSNRHVHAGLCLATPCRAEA